MGAHDSPVSDTVGAVVPRAKCLIVTGHDTQSAERSSYLDFKICAVRDVDTLQETKQACEGLDTRMRREHRDFSNSSRLAGSLSGDARTRKKQYSKVLVRFLPEMLSSPVSLHSGILVCTEPICRQADALIRAVGDNQENDAKAQSQVAPCQSR
jgi:hypothetical protein